ncbi:HIT family protein [Thermococcus gorgonarius]|uniref:HIT family hydrolase n=1 Tax=Thermococcus gorgonarius TaxID=71997 RepID=A0A2Z2M4Z9_THEGO|nr:HIT family protein [Thermococcus gorgonarius]ASJ00059.1 HIT family hydrolase [Thermococcus gorgonarius]
MKCPFCNPDRGSVLYEGKLVRILLDGYPASRGHLLVVPKRHVESWDEIRWEEKEALLRGIELAMKALKDSLKPDGFNVGINLGEAAGQTVPHLHVHVIPRWKGDCKSPRGGVRKAVLDLEDENLSMKERWERNRLNGNEIQKLKHHFDKLINAMRDV